MMQNLQSTVLQESEFDYRIIFPTIFFGYAGIYELQNEIFQAKHFPVVFFMFEVPKNRLYKYDTGNIFLEKAIQTFQFKIFCPNKDIFFGKFRGGEKFLCFFWKS